MKSKKKTLIIIILLIIFIVWISFGNYSVKMVEYKLIDNNLPSNFNGYKIIQISDFHNGKTENINEQMCEMIREKNPDIIVLTGDMIDSSSLDIKASLDFLEKVSKIATCYYVTGNHEAAIDDKSYTYFEEEMTKLGVNVLRNESQLIERQGQYISLIGIDDPNFQEELSADISEESAIEYEIDNIDGLDNSKYQILLSHRPEYFETYVNKGMNLILSGHTHGGQIRLPLIGGIIAPGQGLFPQYDVGQHSADETNMIISAGIGNSIIPVRINNKSEIVFIELKCK